MPIPGDSFYNSRSYKLLVDHSNYSNELLQQLQALLHEEPDLAEVSFQKEGSLFHVVCRTFSGHENIICRMIYVLSNAGADPNVPDGKGNTPLHEVLLQDCGDRGLELLQALFRVGADPRLVNYDGRTADAYIRNNPSLTEFCKTYGRGIWAAVDSVNITETDRLIKGFIKVDCKHNSNKTLLDKARDLNNTSVIHILADYQVTNEFVHSILACDWDRASIIYKYEYPFIKLHACDSIHRLTSHRMYSKSLLEHSLETHSAKPWEILFCLDDSNVDVNILCTDGFPFFFHCFDDTISRDIRKKILYQSNLYIKSFKGETFLFHLIDLYCEKENEEYLLVFTNILYNYPLLLAQRNEHEHTIVERLELTDSIVVYQKLRPFYEAIMNILLAQLKKNLMVQKLILYHFGYYLLFFFKNQTLEMTKYVYQLLRSLKEHQGLSVSIENLIRTITNDEEEDLLKLKTIFQNKEDIYYSRDTFGRTCAHLAVLHQKYIILKFLCDNHKTAINARDNLNRTCLHYACIMNDRISFDILEKANAKHATDCMNLYPNDYLLHRHLCSAEFQAQGFPSTDIQRKSSATSNFLKISFYSSLKTAIINNAVEDIQTIARKITQMGFHLKDFDPNSSSNDYVQGEPYIPLLFLGVEHRSIASIRCLIELGVPPIGQMSKTNKALRQIPLVFHSQAEDSEYFDMTDIINALQDETELKDAFKQPSPTLEITSPYEIIKIEEENLDCQSITSSKERKMMNKLFRQNENSKSQTCTLC